MRSHKFIPALALAAVSAFASPLCAQQGQQQSGGAATPVQPISGQVNTGNSSGAVPAARGLFVGYEPADSNNNGTSQLEPDDRPLSGVESLSLGVLHSLTTLFDPSFFVSESIYGGNSRGWNDTATSIGGGFGLVRDWKHSRIGLQYFGGQSFYTPASQFDGSYHTLDFSQSVSAGRWNFLWHEDLIFTPSSTFTSLQSGVLPSTGIGSSSGLQPGLVPASTIATGQVSTLNSATTGQVAYSFTRRSMITVSGSYGLLHFMSPGYVGTNTLGGMLGFDYALSPMNSVSATYSYSRNSFSTSSEGVESHTVAASFGRKVTGKLALQVAGGPQLVQIRNGSGGLLSSSLSWSATTSVTYGPKPRNFSYSFTYGHGLSDGSGVLFGSESDTVGISVRTTFARYWGASINSGYASSRALVNATVGATRYDTWTTGVSVGRALSRKLNMTASYLYQHQIQNGTCPVRSCGLFPGSQSISARLEWHPWPPRLQ